MFLQELAWGILFLDVVAAFESLQRFFVFGERISDANICFFSYDLGFEVDIFDDCITNICAANVFRTPEFLLF